MNGGCLISGSCLISGYCLISASCLISGKLGGAERAFLHSAHLDSRLPCMHPLQTRQLSFRLP